MSTAEPRETVERVADAVAAGLEYLPAPLYVSLVGLGMLLVGPVVQFAGYPILAAMVGAYGIATTLWGVAAWLVVLVIVRQDTYRR